MSSDRGEEGGTFEPTGKYFEMYFNIKIAFQEYGNLLVQKCLISTIYVVEGIRVRQLLSVWTDYIYDEVCLLGEQGTQYLPCVGFWLVLVSIIVIRSA